MIVVAWALIVLGGLLSVLSWATFFVSLLGKRFVSAVPLFGALLLAGGLILIPETGLCQAYVVLGELLSVLSWATFFVSLLGKRFVSAVPLFGALLLAGGLILIPETRRFAWLAVVADFGTFALMIALPRLVYEFWSTSRVNLLHCFTIAESERIISFKLFRRHIAVISARFTPPMLSNDNGAHVVSFGMSGRWVATENGFSIDGYRLDRRLLISRENDNYITVEFNYPGDEKYKYDFLDGLSLQKQEWCGS